MSTQDQNICGDCYEGRCHGGDGPCGCHRHAVSVAARQHPQDTPTEHDDVRDLIANALRMGSPTGPHQQTGHYARTGRHNPYTVYRVTGEDDAGRDFIGAMRTREDAAEVVAALNLLHRRSAPMADTTSLRKQIAAALTTAGDEAYRLTTGMYDQGELDEHRARLQPDYVLAVVAPLTAERDAERERGDRLHVEAMRAIGALEAVRRERAGLAAEVERLRSALDEVEREELEALRDSITVVRVCHEQRGQLLTEEHVQANHTTSETDLTARQAAIVLRAARAQLGLTDDQNQEK